MPMYRKVNKNFFKKWTPEMAYVLGFFAADGNLIENKRGGCYFSIQIRDKDLLEKIKQVMNSEHKISMRKILNPRHSQLYRLQIGSVEIYDDLKKLGFVANKTFRLKIPPVPKEFFGDFLRGYFDGDGNVWSGEVHKDRKRKTLVISVGFTSGCKEFLIDLHKNLEYFGIKGGNICKKERGYNLKYSILDSLKIYKIMYDMPSNGLLLDRKKIIFDKFIKERHKNAAVV